MANNISSMMMAQLPTSARDSGQYAKLNTTGAAGNGGSTLPQQGEVLPQKASAKPVKDVELREAVSQINGYVQSVQRDLSFSVDEGSGRSVIKVIDRDSGETVRQIPSEEVLALASYLKDLNQDTQGITKEVPQGILFSDSI